MTKFQTYWMALKTKAPAVANSIISMIVGAGISTVSLDGNNVNVGDGTDTAVITETVQDSVYGLDKEVFQDLAENFPDSLGSLMTAWHYQTAFTDVMIIKVDEQNIGDSSRALFRGDIGTIQRGRHIKDDINNTVSFFVVRVDIPYDSMHGYIQEQEDADTTTYTRKWTFALDRLSSADSTILATKGVLKQTQAEFLALITDKSL